MEHVVYDINRRAAELCKEAAREVEEVTRLCNEPDRSLYVPG